MLGSTKEVDSSTVIVLNKKQTIYDRMLIEDLIELPQHIAANLMIQSLNVTRLQAFGESPLYKKGDSISDSDKRAVVSNAYRSMVDAALEKKSVKMFMSYCRQPFEYDSNIGALEPVSKTVMKPLWTLVNHYQIRNACDPRKIIRRQISQG